MDIVIHGTKGGRAIFTPKKLPGLLDVTSDTSRAAAIGQQAYAIRFTADYSIFSKYKIIRDVRGDKRIGFIAFSLFLTNNEELSGKDIIALLDKVSDEYYRKYIPNNDDNLNEVIENWDFLDPILIEYPQKIETVSSYDTNTLTSGSKDDAFVYFKDQDELQKYFDAPFQEEYSNYRQILFVTKELQGKPENPLNALRHSDNNLTEKIDYTKREYKLKDYYGQGNNGVSIEIRTKDKICANNDKITNKDNITITYFKEFCKPIPVSGKLSDGNIRQYLHVSEINGTIEVKKDVELIPETKTVKLKIRDSKGNSINDAEAIYYGNYQSKRNVDNNSITFKGEELGQKWAIAARKGKLSGGIFITPMKLNDDVPLILNENCIVQIHVRDKDTNEEINNFAVWNNKDGGGYSFKNEIEFVGEDIEKEWNISIKCKGYESKDIKKYCPAKDNNKSLLIVLKRSDNQLYIDTEQRYRIDTNKHGIKICNAGYSQKKDGSDLGDNPIKPNKGWKFINFKFSEKKEDGFDGTLVAQYEKRKSFFEKVKIKPKLKIAGLVVVIIVLGLGIWALYSHLNTKETKLDEEQIKKYSEYVEGDTLSLNTLVIYSDNWKTQEPVIGNSVGSMLPGNDGKKTDSTEYKKWDNVLQGIKKAIEKRKLIDNLNFVELKGLSYSISQRKFQAAVNEMNSLRETDEVKYGKVCEQLGNVSALTLTEIAGKTDSIVESLNKTKPVSPQREQQIFDQTEISSYLQYNPDLKIESVDMYYKMKGLDSVLNNGLKLCKNFWDKVQRNADLEEFRTIGRNVIRDENLKQNTSLTDFLTNICNDNNYFQKYKNVADKSMIKSLTQLKTKINSSSSGTSTDTKALPSNITTEIIEYLRGAELDKQKLNEYMNMKKGVVSNELKKSILLCLDFWKLDGYEDKKKSKNNRTYWSLRDKVNEDTNFNSSKLKTFLDKMCELENPKYGTEDKIKGLKQ